MLGKTLISAFFAPVMRLWQGLQNGSAHSHLLICSFSPPYLLFGSPSFWVFRLIRVPSVSAVANP